MKKITIAGLKLRHKSELAERQKMIDRMEQRRNQAEATNAELVVKKAELQRASQALVDQWAVERLEYQRALQKAREELLKLYTVRNE